MKMMFRYSLVALLALVSHSSLITGSSPLKKPPGEGTGPTRQADLRGNLVGRVPPRGEPDVFQQAVNSPPKRPEFVLVPIASPEAHHRAVPHIRNRNGTSQNWGGYAVASNLAAPTSGVVSDVKGTWTVPSLSPSESSSTYSSSWVGIDGYSDNTVEQIGTEQDLTRAGPDYYAWFEMYPKVGYRILNFPVEADDTISAEVHYAGNNRFKLTIRNVTKNVSFSTTQRSKAKRQSAEWIVEPPYSGGILPLADFGTISFSACSATLNGNTGSIGASAWQHDAITMAYHDGIIKAQPSNLTGGGTGFSVSWNNE